MNEASRELHTFVITLTSSKVELEDTFCICVGLGAFLETESGGEIDITGKWADVGMEGTLDSAAAFLKSYGAINK